MSNILILHEHYKIFGELPGVAGDVFPKEGFLHRTSSQGPRVQIFHKNFRCKYDKTFLHAH